MLATVSTARRPRTKGTLKNKGPLQKALRACKNYVRVVKGSVVKGTTRDTAHSW